MSPPDVKTVRYFYPCGDIFAKGADTCWSLGDFPLVKKEKIPSGSNSPRHQSDSGRRKRIEGGKRRWREKQREKCVLYMTI